MIIGDTDFSEYNDLYLWKRLSSSPVLGIRENGETFHLPWHFFHQKRPSHKLLRCLHDLTWCTVSVILLVSQMCHRCPEQRKLVLDIYGSSKEHEWSFLIIGLFFGFASDSVFAKIDQNINKYWDGNAVFSMSSGTPWKSSFSDSLILFQIHKIHQIHQVHHNHQIYKIHQIRQIHQLY